MHAAEIAQRKEELIALCRRYDVARLEVFGSAARAPPTCDSAAGGVDFLVEFRGESQLHPLEQLLRPKRRFVAWPTDRRCARG